MAAERSKSIKNRAKKVEAIADKAEFVSAEVFGSVRFSIEMTDGADYITALYQRCLVCDKAPTMACEKCHRVNYCSEECMKKHKANHVFCVGDWKEHVNNVIKTIKMAITIARLEKKLPYPGTVGIDFRGGQRRITQDATRETGVVVRGDNLDCLVLLKKNPNEEKKKELQGAFARPPINIKITKK